MLAANRSAAALTSRVGFARALPVEGRVQAVHPSTILRWETGALPVPRAVIVRYEELLDLPVGRLTAVWDLLLGAETHAQDRPRPPTDVPDPQRRRLNSLIEATTSDHQVSGSDWNDLTRHLSTLPAVFLPDRDWEAMAQRLLVEMLAACGTSWVQRYVAINRLLTHASAAEIVIDTCATAVAQHNHQVVTSTMATLGVADHRDAVSAIIGQLHHPTNDRALIGAITALEEARRRNHLDTDQQARAAGALRPLTSPGQDLKYAADAMLLNLAQRTRKPHMASPASPNPQQAQVIDRLTTRATALLAHDPAEQDSAILHELITTMLIEPDGDLSLLAAQTLAATPYRRPLAQAVRNEIARPATLTGPSEWSTTLIAALRALGSPADLPLLGRIVNASGIPAETIRVAAFAIAHLEAEIPQAWWMRTVATNLRRSEHQISLRAHTEILRGLTYSAGITGSRAGLELIRTSESAPYEARAAAGWWLNLPAHLVTGARQ